MVAYPSYPYPVTHSSPAYAPTSPTTPVAQLTSRRKQYDSKGREKLESKADLRARGVESPDRADAIIGAIILAQDRQVNWAEARELRDEIRRRARRGGERFAGNFPRTHLEW